MTDERKEVVRKRIHPESNGYSVNLKFSPDGLRNLADRIEREGYEVAEVDLEGDKYDYWGMRVYMARHETDEELSQRLAVEREQEQAELEKKREQACKRFVEELRLLGVGDPEGWFRHGSD